MSGVVSVMATITALVVGSVGTVGTPARAGEGTIPTSSTTTTATVPGPPASNYTLHQLGSPGGSRCGAVAISDTGDIVGVADDAAGVLTTYRWTVTSGPTVLPITSGLPVLFAQAVNSHGDVVGDAPDPGPVAAWWNPDTGAVADLAFDGPGFSSALRAVNDRRQAVGGVIDNGHEHVAVFDLPAGTRTIPSGLLGFDQAPGDINERGVLVGMVLNNDPAPAFRYDPASDTATLLPTLGGHQAAANGVNDLGVVVGTSSLPGESRFHAFVHQPGSAAPLDITPAEPSSASATAINDQGLVVGASQHFAFVWSASTGVDFLPVPAGAAASAAAAINGSGTIVGSIRTSGARDAPTVCAAWTPVGTGTTSTIGTTSTGGSSGTPTTGTGPVAAAQPVTAIPRFTD